MNNNIDYIELYERQKRSDVRRTFSRFMLALVVLNVITYAVIFLVQYISIIKLGAEAAANLFDNIYMQWFIGVGPMYLLGLPALFLITFNMKTYKREAKPLKAKDFAALFLICQAVTLIGSMIGNTITSLLSNILGKDVSAGATQLIEESPLWLTLIVAVIIGPIVEEFIFRKLLIDRIGRFGDVTAILTSGIAFGIFHANFEQFFYATMLGMIFAFVYVKTGNWLHTAILHIAINFFGSIVALPVMKAGDRVVEAMEALEDGVMPSGAQFIRDIMLVSSYNLIIYAMVFGGLFILFKAVKKRKIQITNDSKVYIPNGQIVQNAFVNVGTILFLIMYFFLFITNIFLG